MHFKIVLEKLALRSGILVLVFAVNNGDEANILFGNLDSGWLRLVELDLEN